MVFGFRFTSLTPSSCPAVSCAAAPRSVNRRVRDSSQVQDRTNQHNVMVRDGQPIEFAPLLPYMQQGGGTNDEDDANGQGGAGRAVSNETALFKKRRVALPDRIGSLSRFNPVGCCSRGAVVSARLGQVKRAGRGIAVLVIDQNRVAQGRRPVAVRVDHHFALVKVLDREVVVAEAEIAADAIEIGRL